MSKLQKIVNNLSIKQKLITLSMITSIFAAMITCTVFIVFDAVSERKDLVEDTILISKIFSEELSEYIIERDLKQIHKSLETLKNRQSIVQACVALFKNGNAEYVSFINEKNRSKNCSDIKFARGKYEFVNDKIIGKHLIVSNYISEKDHKIGTISIVTNFDKINDLVKREILMSLLLLVIIISTSYIISRFLQGTISRPILHLADVSYAVKSGDYNIRASHYSKDELGILTEAYNNMLNKIQFAKEHLEEKVIERTQD
ncbi:MAG: HAMP domain-containing protein, partial [Pseudomonadota bacterium]